MGIGRGHSTFTGHYRVQKIPKNGRDELVPRFFDFPHAQINSLLKIVIGNFKVGKSGLEISKRVLKFSKHGNKCLKHANKIFETW